MAIPSLEAARLYAATAAKTAGGTAAKGPDFSTFLAEELRGAAETFAKGEEVARAGLAGKASVQEVVEAVAAAELALRKVQAVRDRVIAAYQEIMRMPI
ncbi:Flagellar hook-basal body complex protein FliE [bacterium HR39]|nr:Flagellar hook-basal body complex protein FliE [bacterium HR39]